MNVYLQRGQSGKIRGKQKYLVDGELVHMGTVKVNVNVGETVQRGILDSLIKLFKILQEKLGHVGKQAMRPTCVLRL